MEHGDTAQLAAVVGALGAPLVLLARTQAVLLAGFAVVLAAEVGLGYAIAGGVRWSTIVGPAGLAASAGGGVLFAAAAGVLVRYPALVTPAVLAAAPFRLPLDFDREHRFLVSIAEGGQLGRLLPLYGVLTAATLALAFRVLRGAPVAALPRELSVPAAIFLSFAALSVLWTVDLPVGAGLLLYFLLPFAVLVAVVGRSPFPAWLPRALAGVGIGLAALFATVGVFQAATHTLFFYSPTVDVANTYSSFFRVTSLFRDPSLYGRHLVLGIAIVLAALWLGRLRLDVATALTGLLFAGLYFSYSQSSLVALFVIVVLITAVAGDRRGRQLVAVIAALSVLACAGVVAAAVKDESVRRATSDRSRRIETATEVFRKHPIHGVGLGSQPLASQLDAARFAQKPRFVSHTTPLTIAAELGLAGLVAYLAVLAGAARLLDRVRRRDLALGLTLASVLLALFVHSLFYSGFIEDPITWVILGVASSFLVARVGVAAR
ncbi:MAG: O-antigen ligase family protein [Gaiellaceae bacterium]